MTRSTMALALAGLAVLAPSVVRADVGPPPALQGIGVDEHPGAALPLDVPLVDQEGHPVRLGHFFDGRRPVLLVLAYFRCPMLCSLVLDGTAAALAQSRFVPGRDLRVITVSIDPRDHPEDAASRRAVVLKALGSHATADAWPFLTGQDADVRRLADALGFRYRYDEESGQYAHPAVLFAVAPDGRVARYVYGVRFEPETLDTALAAAARGDAGRSLQQALLHCFRYVPSLRRHAGALSLFLRGGAVLILVGLGAVLLVGLRRTRKAAR